MNSRPCIRQRIRMTCLPSERDGSPAPAFNSPCWPLWHRGFFVHVFFSHGHIHALFSVLVSPYESVRICRVCPIPRHNGFGCDCVIRPGRPHGLCFRDGLAEVGQLGQGRRLINHGKPDVRIGGKSGFSARSSGKPRFRLKRFRVNSPFPTATMPLSIS